MNIKKTLSLIWLLVLIAFVFKGLLTDLGIVEKYPYDMVYTFSYLAFAMAAWMFFNAEVFPHIEENKEA